MRTIKTALIGLGRIGWQYHMPEILSHEGFELTAVVDPLAERLAEAQATCQANGYRDHEAMLAAEKPDLVVVASPTPFHVAQVIAAFQAGADVFCDKPIASCLADAEKIMDCAKRLKRKFMAYQPHRTHTSHVALLDILSQDLIGSVFMIRSSMSRWRRRVDWQAWKKHGGGMLYNYGAHLVDQLLNLTGSRAKHVSCSTRTVASLGDAEDVVKILIETESGVILDIDINQAAAWPMPRWQVLARRGGAQLDQENDCWQVRYYLDEELPKLEPQQTLAAKGRNYKVGDVIPWHEKSFPLSEYERTDFYKKCYEYFAEGAEPFVRPDETMELMRVLEECRIDAAANR